MNMRPFIARCATVMLAVCLMSLLVTVVASSLVGIDISPSLPRVVLGAVPTAVIYGLASMYDRGTRNGTIVRIVAASSLLLWAFIAGTGIGTVLEMGGATASITVDAYIAMVIVLPATILLALDAAYRR